MTTVTAIPPCLLGSHVIASIALPPANRIVTSARRCRLDDTAEDPSASDCPTTEVSGLIR